MINPIRNSYGEIRNGWWILFFYMALAAMLIPLAIRASGSGTEVTIPLQALLVSVATGVCLAARREHPRAVLGTVASWRSGIAAGLALGVAIWGIAALVLWVTGAVEWKWQGTAFEAIQAGVVDCIAVAVTEELLFRGFVFQRLVNGIGTWPAQLTMASYFTLTHSSGLANAGDLQWLAAANIFLASLLFGAIYLGTRSLAMPLALHFTLNFVEGPLLGFGVSGHAASGIVSPIMEAAPDWWTGGVFGLEASLPGTVVVLASLIMVLTFRTGSTRRTLLMSRSTHLLARLFRLNEQGKREKQKRFAGWRSWLHIRSSISGITPSHEKGAAMVVQDRTNKEVQGQP